MSAETKDQRKRRGLQTRAQIEGRERARETRKANLGLRDLVSQQTREDMEAWVRDIVRPERLQNRRLDIYLGRDPLRLVVDNTRRR